MLTLPASAKDVLGQIIVPAFSNLPSEMDSPEARLLVLATGAQETQYLTRQQDDGPARGLFQMQINDIRDLMNNQMSGNHVWTLCGVLGVTYGSNAMFDALLTDDLFAAAMCRLNYWCIPRPLPAIGDVVGCYAYYELAQRPGKPSYSRWKQTAYPQALAAITATTS